MKRIDSSDQRNADESPEAADELDEFEPDVRYELDTAEVDYPSLDAIALLKLAQKGDAEAFDELGRLAVSDGDPIDFYHRNWSKTCLKNALMERVGGRNLMSRAGVESDLESALAELKLTGDGVAERIIIERIALSLVESRSATSQHLKIVAGDYSPDMVDRYERIRDRADRRLFAALRALSEIRRINHRANVQVNVGDGNINILNS